MKLVQMAALVAFTRFVPGHGQVHGDPDSSDEKARLPMVPEHLADKWAEDGIVAEATGAETDKARKAAVVRSPKPAAKPAAKAKGLKAAVSNAAKKLARKPSATVPADETPTPPAGGTGGDEAPAA